MDNELFELCREVYKRFPEWNNTKEIVRKYSLKEESQVMWRPPEGMDLLITAGSIEWEHPLYTSDYLLEKLPGYLTRKQDDEVGDLRMIKTGSTDGSYTYFYEFGVPEYRSYSDTPLKALLKLTIALHEAGELK